MPAELRPNWKRKLNQKEGSRKAAKDVNIEETLKVLEQKEKSKRPGGAPNDDETKSENVSTSRNKPNLQILYMVFIYFIRMFLGRCRR